MKYYKPEIKLPINRKMLNFSKIIEDYVKDKNPDRKDDDEYLFYKRRKIWDWIDKREGNVNLTFPSFTICDSEYEFTKKRDEIYGMKTMKHFYMTPFTIFELPKSYDSNLDKEKYKKDQDEFLLRMKEMVELSGKVFKKETYLDNVNFGSESFEYINDFLSFVYDKYSKHYKNDSIECWFGDGEYESEDIDFIYPFEEKAIHLSELEKFLTEMGLDSTGLYEWILRCTYVEGRYWETTWYYELGENFRKEKEPENIKQINELLRQLYKSEKFTIFIDYYKEIDEKIFD